MQQSVNREAFDRKISQVYDLIDLGDFKKALKTINSLLEKGSKKSNLIEKLSYQVVKAYVLDRSNKRKEALIEIDELIKDIVSNSLIDYGLLD